MCLSISFYLSKANLLSGSRNWTDKTALHAKFDEGMNNLDKMTPNSRQLRLELGRHLPVDEFDSPDPPNVFRHPVITIIGFFLG